MNFQTLSKAVYIQIQWTTSSVDEAKAIAKELLAQKLIACVNILPGIESLYVWEGKIQEGQEVKVLLKTKKEHFTSVLDYIKKHGSYDVPEVGQVEITGGNPDYIDWLNNEVR